MSKVVELFGCPSSEPGQNWENAVRQQQCPFLGKRCYKVRKSDPGVSIGTCTVLYGRAVEPIIICPKRLIERRQIFVDCLHLLTTHEPGNELHIVPEISIPAAESIISSCRRGTGASETSPASNCRPSTPAVPSGRSGSASSRNSALSESAVPRIPAGPTA